MASFYADYNKIQIKITRRVILCPLQNYYMPTKMLLLTAYKTEGFVSASIFRRWCREKKTPKRVILDQNQKVGW